MSQNKLPKRYSENSKGDFYSERGVCTSCGAPAVEAPDLIEHSKKEYGHCYFKRQPQTNEEIECAINAIAVSCIAGLRYGRTDEKILKRLYEIGEEDQCDHKPIGNYKMLVWNKVIFKYKGTIRELYDKITNQLVVKEQYLDNRIVDSKTNDTNYFEFIYRWTDGFTGIYYRCTFNSDGLCEILMEKESYGYLVTLRGNAITLNLIMCNDENAQEITWVDLDGKSYDSKAIK